MAVLAFLSYSHKDKRIAGKLKEVLSQYGFDVFLAHDDLSPSDEWQRTIIRRLRKCHVFLALLTKNFPESEWTDQEAGIAVVLGKVVIPLKFDINPYGFISKYQALKVTRKITPDSCWKIVRTLANHRRLGDSVKQGVISLFGQSSSFEEATHNAKLLSELAPFSEEQLNQVLRGGINNQNIHGSWKARPYIDQLMSRAKGKISQGLVARYRVKVRLWDER